MKSNYRMGMVKSVPYLFGVSKFVMHKQRKGLFLIDAILLEN